MPVSARYAGHRDSLRNRGAGLELTGTWKGSIGSEGPQPGQATREGRQSQGDWMSWLDSSVRRQGWRADGPRGQGLSHV